MNIIMYIKKDCIPFSLSCALIPEVGRPETEQKHSTF